MCDSVKWCLLTLVYVSAIGKSLIRIIILPMKNSHSRHCGLPLYDFKGVFPTDFAFGSVQTFPGCGTEGCVNTPAVWARLQQRKIVLSTHIYCVSQVLQLVHLPQDWGTEPYWEERNIRGHVSLTGKLIRFNFFFKNKIKQELFKTHLYLKSSLPSNKPSVTFENWVACHHQTSNL